MVVGQISNPRVHWLRMAGQLDIPKDHSEPPKRNMCHSDPDYLPRSFVTFVDGLKETVIK